MPEIHELPLQGCTTEPLMNYLKALGVLRIVAEQKDTNACGKWHQGVFVLRSNLDEAALAGFFAQEYQPTPIVSPWNGDGGFLTESGASFETISQIRNSPKLQLKRIQDVIAKIEKISLLADFAKNRDRSKVLTKKKNNKNITDAEAEELKTVTSWVKEIKTSIVFQLRNELPDESLIWLDACMQIGADGFTAAPVLGSGGCDGRLEFSSNYLQNLLLILDDPQSPVWLNKALLGKGDARLISTSIGQFAPGCIGGPNATQGMEGDSMLNPWDYVLMIEGVVLFAGSVTRKLNTDRGGKAAFPFTVLPSDVGGGSLERNEAKESRGEMWLPLWDRFASIGELAGMFSEGRSQMARQQSRTTVDFARAVAALGVDRGIRSFVRQGFLKRNGLAFLATPLGQFDVQSRDGVDLLRQLDPWLESFRRACGNTAPTRFPAALRRVEGAIFDFCRYGGTPCFARILAALGRAERELATSNLQSEVRPLSGLSGEWLAMANDGSLEFELAWALAGIQDSTIGPLRANLEPVDWKSGDRRWAERDRRVVWNSADLPANLIAVLQRRVMDGDRQGCTKLPLRSERSAVLAAVAAFLAGNVDDHRLEELLWGLVAIDPKASVKLVFPPRPAESLPRPYALLKLLFLPDPPVAAERGSPLRLEPEILPLLSRGDAPAACQIAMRRLRAAGLQPLPHARTGRGNRDNQWLDVQMTVDARRLAAALLFPVSTADACRLEKLVTRPNAKPE